jgi:hypothetical protein
MNFDAALQVNPLVTTGPMSLLNANPLNKIAADLFVQSTCCIDFQSPEPNHNTETARKL